MHTNQNATGWWWSSVGYHSVVTAAYYVYNGCVVNDKDINHQNNQANTHHTYLPSYMLKTDICQQQYLQQTAQNNIQSATDDMLTCKKWKISQNCHLSVFQLCITKVISVLVAQCVSSPTCHHLWTQSKPDNVSVRETTQFAMMFSDSL